MKGLEKDCICDKKKKHKKYCDAYRLSLLLIRMASLRDKPI
jgi:hypothetical protein